MIFSKENFEKSVNRLLSKPNNCGIDGILVSEFADYWKLNEEKILSFLREGKYKPSAVLLEEMILKKGKKRLISKYTCTDRVIQDVLKDKLMVTYKEKFSKYSFAYIPDRGVHEAVRYAAMLINSGKKFVAEIDVKDFFENINLQRLEHFLQKEIREEAERRLIHDYLYSWIVIDGRKERKSLGIVQGSPISPVFSNVYMMDFDVYLEAKYSFCRFADNINIYCNTEEEARKAFADANHYLETKLGLTINQKKSGVYPAITRTFLGYEFKKDRSTNEVTTIKVGKKKYEYYGTWHTSAIQKIGQDYHIISDGILNRKDFSVLFESENHKIFIPVEACSSINIYSNVIFGKSFLEYANYRKLAVNMFDKYGNFPGSFHSQDHYKRTSILLKQVTLYNNPLKRLELAIKIEIASLHNQRENLRYFYKRSRKDSLKKAIELMSDYMSQMKNVKDINHLMMIEARAKQQYLQTFDDMIDNEEFSFGKRTRRPPKNEVNAMISFGNTFLYRRIANEIYKTALDIRIGIVHSSNSRSELFNLDLAEIFKPLIVDRAIFSVIHNLQVHRNMHFETTEEDGIYLNNVGRRIFIRELEKKLNLKLSVNGQKVTYDRIIKNEIHKILCCIEKDEKYKPFKYT